MGERHEREARALLRRIRPTEHTHSCYDGCALCAQARDDAATLAAALAAAKRRGAEAMREFIARRLTAADAEAVRTMMAEDAIEEADDGE